MPVGSIGRNPKFTFSFPSLFFWPLTGLDHWTAARCVVPLTTVAVDRRKRCLRLTGSGGSTSKLLVGRSIGVKAPPTDRINNLLEIANGRSGDPSARPIDDRLPSDSLTGDGQISHQPAPPAGSSWNSASLFPGGEITVADRGRSVGLWRLA